MTKQDLFNFCREVNPYLAIVALGLLGYRMVPTLFVYGLQTGIARSLWAGYIFITALGSWESQRVGNKATYVSPFLMSLHIGVIILFSLWDFGLEKQVTEKREARERATGAIRTRRSDDEGRGGE